MKQSRILMSLIQQAKHLSALREDESSWLKMHNILLSINENIKSPEDTTLVISELKEFIIKTMLSDRSRLSGASINLLNKIITLQNESFNENVFISYLFKLVNKPNKVFNQRAEESLMLINNKLLVKNFLILKEHYSSANRNVRRVVIKLLIKADDLLNQEMKSIIEKAKNDNCGEVRKLAKDFSCVSNLLYSPLKKVHKTEEQKPLFSRNIRPIEKKLEIKKEININELIFDLPKKSLNEEIINKLIKNNTLEIKENKNDFQRNGMTDKSVDVFLDGINKLIKKDDKKPFLESENFDEKYYATNFLQKDDKSIEKFLEKSEPKISEGIGIKEISLSEPTVTADKVEDKISEKEIVSDLSKQKVEIKPSTNEIHSQVDNKIQLTNEFVNEEESLVKESSIIKDDGSFDEEKKELINKDQLSKETFVKDEQNDLETKSFINEEIVTKIGHEIMKQETTVNNEIIEEDAMKVCNEEININITDIQLDTNKSLLQEDINKHDLIKKEVSLIENVNSELIANDNLSITNRNITKSEDVLMVSDNQIKELINEVVSEDTNEIILQETKNDINETKEESFPRVDQPKNESLDTEKIFTKEVKNISFVSREDAVEELSLIFDEKISIKEKDNSKSLIKESNLSINDKECYLDDKEETSFLINQNKSINDTVDEIFKPLSSDKSYSSEEKILNSFINNINQNNMTREEENSNSTNK